MKPSEFFQEMQQTEPAAVLTVSPGPLAIKTDWHDALAARLLLWLNDELPPDATAEDLHEVLDAAKWWWQFWDSLVVPEEDVSLGDSDR